MKKILFGLIAILIGITLALVSMEIFLRMNPRFRYISTSFRMSEPPKAGMAGHFEECCLRPSPLLGYENIPGCCGVNSYGLKGKDYKFLKTGNTFRILLLGDSIAWMDLIRAPLEQDLNSSLNSKYKFEIWNAGVPSYDIRRYYLYLKHKGLNYKPDIKIYYKGRGGAAAYDFPLGGISKRFIVNPVLMKHSYLYRLAVLRLNSSLAGRKNSRIDRALEDGRYYLGMIKELCRKNEIPLFIVIFPYLKPLKEFEPRQQVQFRNISTVVGELKLDYLNLYGLYDRLLRENFPLKERQDEIHPSEAASKIIAGEIYNYILEKENNIFL